MKNFLILLCIVLFLSGCTSPQKTSKNTHTANPAKANPNGRLVFSLGGQVSIINPILSTDSVSSALEGVIFSGLVRVNEKLELIPDIAEKWEVSKDGKVWIFFLRKGVKFHDGKELTAEDCKFTFESILNPKVNSVRRGDHIIDGQPIKYEVVDRYTLKAILPKPFAPFLIHMAMGILPKHLLEGKDLNRSNFNRHPIGSGPFKLAEWKAANNILVTRNEDFYLGKPKLGSILFRVIPDENVRLVALEAGEIDETDVPPKDYRRMKKAKGINVFDYESMLYTFLGFNLKRPIFQDKKVRQALCYATDKRMMVNRIFKGLATPAYSPSSPVSWSYSDKVEKYLFNRKKAGQLLDEAGWKIGEDNYRYKDGKRLEFTIITNMGNKEREKAAVILQNQFKKIGVKANIRILEWSALVKITNQKEKDFDAIIIGWSLGLDPDGYSIWHSSQYPAGLNFIGYANKEVDKLLSAGRIAMKKEERKKIYAKINKLITEDAPYVFLWYPKSIVAVRDRVGGLAKPGPAGLFVEMEKVFVEK